MVVWTILDHFGPAHFPTVLRPRPFSEMLWIVATQAREHLLGMAEQEPALATAATAPAARETAPQAPPTHPGNNHQQRSPL